MLNDTPSITTYLGGANATVQDVSLTHHNRGVFIDGTLIAKPTFPWRLEGNPWAQDYYNEKAWWGDNIRLATGTYQVTAIDLELPAPGFTWPIARSYNARQHNGSTYVTSPGYQGNNWFQMSQPQLVFLDNDSSASTREIEDRLFLIYGADRYIEFLRVNDDVDEFRAINGAAGVIQHVVNSSAPDLYTYYDPFGTETVFFGIADADIADEKEGMLWKISDPAGNVAYVGHETSATTALSSGYDSSGRIVEAFDTAGRMYTYEYFGGMLMIVTAEVNTGSGWKEVGRVNYDYYDGIESFGEEDDLKYAITTLPIVTEGTTTHNDIRTTYYRYLADSKIQYVLEPEGTRNYDWSDDGAFNLGYESAGESAIKPYAAAAFTSYDSDRRITAAFFNGECGCSGGVNGLHEFDYEDSAYFGNNETTSYDSFWATRTITTLPDTKPDTGQTEDRAYFVNYYDEVGQPMGRIIMNGTDSGLPGSIVINTNTWVAWVERNGDGQIVELTGHTSATDYDHAATTQDPVTIATGAGLVLSFARVGATGDLTGFLASHGKKKGTAGSEALSASFEYTTRTKTIGAATLVRPLITKSRSYDTVTSTVSAGTAMDRATTFFSDTASNRAYLAAKTETITWPAVPTAENGSNTTDDEVWYFRKDGTTAFHKATDGVFTHWSEDGFGLTDLVVADADLGSADFDAADDALFTDWGLSTTGLGTLHEDVAYSYDEQGRLTLTTRDPGGSYERKMPMHHHVLLDRRLVTLDIPRQAAGPSYFGPVSYKVYNQAGQVEVAATIAIAAAGTTTAPIAWIDETDDDPVGAIDTGTLAHLAVNVYDAAGTRLDETRSFHTLGTSLASTTTSNYDPTSYTYDNRGRVIETINPKGTIQSFEYDIRGNFVTKVSVASAVDNGGEQRSQFIRPETQGPTGPPSIFSNPNVMGGDYPVNQDTGPVNSDLDPSDGDNGTGDGDGSPSQSTCLILTFDSNETSFTRDYRGRVAIRENPIAPHLLVAYDNRDRIVEIGYYSDVTGLVAGDVPSSKLSNLLGLVKFHHDVRGTTWKIERHDIDHSGNPTNPSVIDDTLAQIFWADERGRTVKAASDQLTKTVYDALSRPTHQFILAKDDDASYANATDPTLSGDHVLEEHQTAYEAHTGNVLFTAAILRHHGDTTTTGRLDDNADSNPLTLTASNLDGRAQIMAYWYDDLDRLVEEVNFGTYGLNESGGPTAYSGATVASDPAPTRSDTVLRTTYTYNDDGELATVVDPRELKTTYEYDPMGRVVLRIANDTVASPPLSGTNRDNDIYTRMKYFKSHALTSTTPWVDELWVDVNGDGVQDSGVDQVTKYTYGEDNGFQSGDLLKSITYPDGGVVTYEYQVNGILTSVTEPIGSSTDVVTTTFQIDELGRRENATVTAIPTTIDGDVNVIAWTYDTLGRLKTVTQKDGGTVLDEVLVEYDGWGNIAKIRQDHDSTVISGSGVAAYDVAFAHEDATAGARTLRRTSMTLPNSNVIGYRYSSTSGSLDDGASRVSQIHRGGNTNYVEYGYMGLDHVVGIEYPVADVFRRHYGTTAGTYPTLDRFDRVVQDRWTKDLTTDRHFYDQDWTYDRNHNPTVADDHVHATLFDMAWTIDDLNRVIQAERGQWGGSSISTLAEDELWTLTTVGGWALHRLDGDGNGTFTGASDLDVEGTLNVANELTTRLDKAPNPDVTDTLSYNDRGDLTNDGRNYKYTYDAFGRLRMVHNQSDVLVAEYRYNGLGYLIGIRYDSTNPAGLDSSDPWLHLVYDDQWRVVSEHWGSETKPDAIYVHHAGGVAGSGSYIDELAFRERDYDNDASKVLEERRYYAQNWRKDVVAMLDASGGLVEQVRYSSYGVPYGLPAGDTDSDGDFDSADVAAITGGYDVRKDANLDGTIDVFDVLHASNMAGGGGYVTTGRDVLGGSDNANRFGYAAYLRDPAVPQWHVRNRVFRSDIGRWLTRDPMLYADGYNLYTYSQSRPVQYVDALGLDSSDVREKEDGKETKDKDTGIIDDIHKRRGAYYDYTLKCGFKQYGTDHTIRRSGWTHNINGLMNGMNKAACCVDKFMISTHHVPGVGVYADRAIDACPSDVFSDKIKPCHGARINLEVCNGRSIAERVANNHPNVIFEIEFTDGTNQHVPIDWWIWPSHGFDFEIDGGHGDDYIIFN